MGLLPCLLLPWLATYPWVGGGVGTCHGAPTSRWFQAALAGIIGLGVGSASYFLWLICVGSPGVAYCIVESTVFGTVGCVGCRLFPPPKFRVTKVEGKSGIQPGPRWLRIAFQLALVFAAIGVVDVYLTSPLGEWDAWTIWNQRARCLFLAGPDWPSAFSPVFAHPDYPLLIPLVNVRCWTYLRGNFQFVPWLTGVIYTFSTVAILTGGIASLRNAGQGLLAGLPLLGSISFLCCGAAQCADVPLAGYFVSAVLLLAIHDSAANSKPALLLLSGLSAGLAAWTKNEGCLFLVVLLAVRTAVAWNRGSGAEVRRQLAPLLLGMLPAVALAAYFKIHLVTTNNDLLEGQGWSQTLTRLLDPTRYWMIAGALVEFSFRVGKVLVIALPLYLLLVGRAVRPKTDRGLAAAGAIVGLMLAGYCVVYVTTPHDLNWHLNTSLERLLVQLWPAGLAVIFLYCDTPEKLFGVRQLNPHDAPPVDPRPHTNPNPQAMPNL